MLLKISKLLYDIAFKIRSKSLYLELKYFINKKQSYLKDINYYDRGIGKSYNLIKLAVKYKCPIFISNHKMESYIKSLAYKILNRKKYNKLKTIVINNYGARGRRYKLGLAEEGFKESDINGIIKPMVTTLVGYRANY